MSWLPALLALGVVAVVAAALLLVRRRRRLPPPEDRPALPEAAPPETAALPPAAPPTLLDRLADGLTRTRDALKGRLDGVFSRARIDEALFADLEEALLLADVGVGATGRVLARLREDTARMGLSDPVALRARLAAHLVDLLRAPGAGLAPVPADGPLVILVVGVNGGGKTTTIGKLAARYAREGHRVLVGAGDTFRAGAIQQLGAWAERAGADLVARDEGSDPAAVLFDAVAAARARGRDVVICDTAGRLQSRRPLMDELSKVTRVLGRALPGAPHEVLLVLDATIGQNALSQARLFGQAVPLTGLVLTKLDGTARGGVVVAVRQETGLPVKLIGVGVRLDDLRPFDPEAFVDALLAPEADPPARS